MSVSTIRALRFGVLGPLSVDRGGSPVDLGGPKQRAVLAMLLASPGRSVSRDRIMQGVWGEEVSEASRGSFHTYLSNLRALLGDVIVRQADGYRLEVAPKDIDAVAFEEAVDDARRQIATDAHSAADMLRAALGVWRGLPYADLIDVPGLQTEIRRLEELRLSAVELRIDADLAAGREGSVISEAEALAEEHPTRERFRAQHMLALYRTGRQAEALRAFRRTEAYLADELGLEPSQELRDLELGILQQDEDLRAGPGRVTMQRLAFLVTDIEESTRAWDLHPQHMAEALAIHDRILTEAIETAGGRIFKHTGDGALAVFPAVEAAVAAAEAAQRAFAAMEWGDIGELNVRMGVDVGDAEARGGDFYGPPLNRAARLSTAGHGGQVLISASAQAEIVASALAGVQIRQLGEHRLKGLVTPERVGQIVFVGLPADFPPLRLDTDTALDEKIEMRSLPGYELRERIGEGALGVVYRAYQPSVGREVAIKVIRPELASHPAFVRHFEAEARTIARLGHPHIVPLIDFWRDPEGAYLVLQLVPGGSLREVMSGGGIDAATARRVLRHVGGAIDRAHAQSVVHGDLQPSNVLLDAAGNAYLSDFGIAARLIEPEIATSFSTSPEYVAPEMLTDGPSPASDLYGLGVLARDLLSHESIEPVLARATATNAADRYPSASAFLADLDEALGEETVGVEPALVSRNPFKGLRAFDESDAPDFFGRDELVGALLTAVARHRFVTVVGPSGSGKSSAVRAGLLPALIRGGLPGAGHWFRGVFIPGPAPIDALAQAIETMAGAASPFRQLLEDEGLAKTIDRALGDAPGEALLVIDQFEEVFTLVDEPKERQEFLDLIVAAVSAEGSRLRVVATLRADFYDRPLEHGSLDRLVRDGLVTVLRPTREELTEMITAPAQAVGLRFEPGLPQRMAQDVAEQPGGLPLLQYALTELVESRRGNLITGNDYARIGGVAGALAIRSEAVFADLPTERKETARQVFLRLVTVDEEADDTRRRVRRSELESLGIDRAAVDDVIEAFTAERLLLADRDPVTRGPTTEVAHEALLRKWPRLRGWIEDQRETLILGRRFRAAMAEWEGAGQDKGFLLTGSRLAPFLAWSQSSSLTQDERSFYEASVARDGVERTARRRRRRILTAVLALATGVSSVLGGMALLQTNRAADERDRALQAEAAAEEQAGTARVESQRAQVEAIRAHANSLAASATVAISNDPRLAKLLGLAGARELATIGDEPTIDTITVLHRAWANDRVVAEYRWPEERDLGLFLETRLSPSGSRLVASGTEGSGYLEVFDLDEGSTLWSFEAVNRAEIGGQLFSPGGDAVAAGVEWPAQEGEATPARRSLGAFVLNADTGATIAHFDLGPCGGRVLDVSSTHLAAVPSVSCLADYEGVQFDGYSDQILLIGLGTGERSVVAGSWPQLTLSGDGRYVAWNDETTAEPRSLVATVDTGETVLEYNPYTTGQLSWGHTRDINRDGSLILAGDRPLAVWDVASGEIIARFEGHAGEAFSATFAPDGESVYSMGREGTLRHWDARTGEEIAVLPAVGGGEISAATDGVVLVTDIPGRRANLIDTRDRGEVWQAPTCGGFILSGALSAAAGRAVVSDWCGDEIFTYVLDTDSGEVVGVVSGHQAQDLKISPDGERFVRQDGYREIDDTGLHDWVGPITVRDTASTEVIAEFAGICTFDNASGLPPEEQEGCAEYPDTPFPLWNWKFEWSPDGSLVAVAIHGGFIPVVVIWNAVTGEQVGAYEGCTNLGAESTLFSPDGLELIVFCAEEGLIAAVSTVTWEETRSAEIDLDLEGSDRLGLIGFTADGSHLVAVGGATGFGAGSLFWIDAESLQLVQTLPRIHEGSPKSWGMSPDRTLVATGSSDGFVKVWYVGGDAPLLVHEIEIGNIQVQGVAFIDYRHLAVAPETGGVFVYTLDVDELVRLVEGSLSRGFTANECAKYFDDAKPCPTLEELRGLP